MNYLFNGLFSDLLLKQLFVVHQELIYGLISHNVVLIGRDHALVEEVRDPLSNVKLILFVVF